MFQSLTRPYFFHGSPALVPYFLKSYACQKYVSVEVHVRTASMLTDAASLPHVNTTVSAQPRRHSPSIMVVAVNVQHFLSLDAEDSASGQDRFLFGMGHEVPGKNAFSETCVALAPEPCEAG